MINIFLFISISLLLVFIFGRLLEKINIPWVFSALLLGIIIGSFSYFKEIETSTVFNFLSDLGMYLLLFIIGLELNISKIKKNSRFIIKGTIVIISIATVFGTLIIHYLLNYNWVISSIVSLSFATVGEAILLPILDEFKMINTKLGQIIIGIGTIDDVVEILSLILVSALIGTKAGGLSINGIIISFIILVILVIGLDKLKNKSLRMLKMKKEINFLLIFSIFFLFLGISIYADAIALGAILAGIAVKIFLPEKILKNIENEVKIVSYGFFVPIFFLWVGMSMDISYLWSYPLIILLIVILSSAAKYIGAYIVGIKELGIKKVILLGTGLSVRFSTSIIVIKILLDNNIIHNDLYSIIIASSIIFTIAIPIVFSRLLHKWNKELNYN